MERPDGREPLRLCIYSPPSPRGTRRAGRGPWEGPREKTSPADSCPSGRDPLGSPSVWPRLKTARRDRETAKGNVLLLAKNTDSSRTRTDSYQ